MEIEASVVKTLRDKTGVSMMQCKRALQESGGNIEKAVEFLRKQGLATAAHKADRTTKEGLIRCFSARDMIAIAEVNSETDFVARNADFQRFVEQVLAVVTEKKPVDIDGLMAADSAVFGGRIVRDVLLEKIATIKENISIRRFKIITVASSLERGFTYLHAGGKIGVLVVLGADRADVLDSAVLQELGKNMAMQVAAANPAYLTCEQVPSAVLEKEREINREITLKEGKPEKIVDKIVDGRIAKWCQNICLVEQEYIRDPNMRVKNVVDSVSKETSAKIAVREFVRFQLGV